MLLSFIYYIIAWSHKLEVQDCVIDGFLSWIHHGKQGGRQPAVLGERRQAVDGLEQRQGRWTF